MSKNTNIVTARNIGHELREQMNHHYLYIKKIKRSKDLIDKSKFTVVWNDIIAVSRCVYENLFSSFVRFLDHQDESK